MWNADQYLKFSDERTQPCRDLVGRILLDRVHSIIDLGCGPGNSTQVLRHRWPEADIVGLDSSSEMIAKAQQQELNRRWLLNDISQWAAEGTEEFDLVFSNAAVHWVPDHSVLLPRLLARCSGALAMQMPANSDGRAYRLMRKMAVSPEWGRGLAELRDAQAHELPFYYDLFAPLTAHLEIWATEYVHIMENAEAIVEWYTGSGLRPYLDALENTVDRARFTAEYLAGIRELYTPRPDGHVLFPFRRLFLIAYRSFPKIPSFEEGWTRH